MANQIKLESDRGTARGRVTYQAVEAAVYHAIDLLNETLAETQHVAKSPRTVLVDRGGRLDSMAVVNLMVFIEDALASELELEIDLIGAHPLAPQDLKTVGTLIDALCRILSE